MSIFAWPRFPAAFPFKDRGRSGAGFSPGRLLQQGTLFLLTFLALMPMQIQLGSRPFGIALIILGLLSLVYALQVIHRGRIGGAELATIAYVLGLVGLFMLNALRVGMRDLSVPVMGVYGIVIFCGCLGLAEQYARLYGDRFIEAALNSLFIIGILHAFIQVIILVSQPAFDAIYSIIFLSDESRMHIEQGYRSPGLFSLGAAVLSSFNALILCIGVLTNLQPRLRPSWKRLILVAFGIAIQIIAIATSGRTGFVILILFSATLMLRGLLAQKQSLLGFNAFKVLLIFLALLSCGLFFVDLGDIENNLKWSFEFIYSLTEGRGLKTDSTSTLFSTMYFLPTSFFELLFGTGNFGRSPTMTYIYSDVGYILMIFGGGIIGMMLMMSFFVLIFIQSRRLRREHGPLAFFLQFFVFTIFILNTKDFYFVQNSGVTQLLILSYALLLTARRRHASSRVPARS